MKKLTTLLLLFILVLSTHAQGIEGDALISIIGSKTDAPPTVSFLNAYDVKALNEAKYSSSKTGIDMTANHDTITSMTLYHNNSLYGDYTGKLPKGITFNMTSAAVVAKLGKGVTVYRNSGYCEYYFGRYVLTCWFEKEVLNSVTIALK